VLVLMSHPIAYLGDTSLTTAASYLAGLMAHASWGFDYIPSHQAVDADFFAAPRKLTVISDYPAARMNAAAQQRLVENVRGGSGLLIIGGWESFHGLGGDWNGTVLSAALPVEIADADDRVNCDQPALVHGVMSHPIIDGLPWHVRPPAIGGFNRITAKAASTVLLEVQRFSARISADDFVFSPTEKHPLLVVGQYGAGRTAALATDVAPHWVGGLVDWGDARIAAQAPGAEAIEVGDLYAAFFHGLLRWAAQL
jgi:hypothetical protein